MVGQPLSQTEIAFEDFDSLAGFFDLLAQYDFEDQKAIQLGVDSSSSVSAPEELEWKPNL